jgi:hypothetical protein
VYRRGPANERVPARVTPSRRGVTSIVRPFFSSERRPHFKTCKSRGKNKNMVMGPDGTRIQDSGKDQQQFTRPTDQKSAVVDSNRRLVSSKRRPHFKTHKWPCNEQKYDHGSVRGPKPRLAMPTKASRKLLLCSRITALLKSYSLCGCILGIGRSPQG